MFDELLAAGADINGTNDQYEHWSPLMLTFHWDQPEMRQVLIDRGAHVGLVEAMLFEDDVLVANLLRAGAVAPTATHRPTQMKISVTSIEVTPSRARPQAR